MISHDSTKTSIQQYAEPIAHTISTAVEITAAIIIWIAVLIAVKDYVLILISKRSILNQRDIRINF